MSNKNLTTICSSFFNEHTNKTILFNEFEDKIVLLEEVTKEDLKSIEEILIHHTNIFYDYNVDSCGRKRRAIKSFFLKLTFEKLVKKYFNYDSKFSSEYMYKTLFQLKKMGKILLPYKIPDNKNAYYNFETYKYKDLFFDNLSNELDNFNNFMINYTNEIHFLQKGTRYKGDLYKKLQRIYFSTNLKSLSDFEPKLAKLIFDIDKEEQKVLVRKNTLISYLFETFNDYYVKNVNQYNWKELYYEKEKNKDSLYFSDFINKIDNTWITYCNEYVEIKSKINKQIDKEISILRKFLSFLMNNNLQFLKIVDMDRKKHFRDISNNNKNTYFEYVKNLNITDRHKNNYMLVVDDFINFIREEYLNRLPVLLTENDRFFRERKNSLTTRKRVPSSIINKAKEILLRNDYEFCKEYQYKHLLNWKLLDENGDKNYWNGFTVVMYILLTYPIRNKQARWLDSGELDEYIIDFEKMEYITNPNPNSIKGRKEGCLQIEEDYFTGKKFYVFHLNTNKTGKPYTIPYVPNEILKMLKEQIEWNRKYGFHFPKPIKAYEREKDRIEENLLEDSVPLTAYPTLKQRKRIGVIKDSMLMKFYHYLMKEVEKEIYEETGEKIVLTYETDNYRKQHKNVFDIHSLRVSGITNLIEAGVPVEVVSQFVAGHSSVVMTLYYNKNSMEEINKIIDDMYNNNKDKLLEDLEKLHSYEDFERQLIPATNEFKRESFKILQDNKGYWNIGLSGICTVSCNELGRDDKCCPKCKYWITGTPFLIGQTTELNDLMYKIRKKADKVKKLNTKYIETFSEQIKGEIELLNDDIGYMISEWSIRYKFIEQSISLLNKKEISNEKLPSLINSNNDLKLGIKNENNFGLSHNICNSSELIDVFENNEAQFELELFVNKILSHNDIEPFLFKLEREDSLKVSNLFAKYILENYNQNHIEELIEGKCKLEYSKINEIKKLINTYDNNLIEYKE